MQKLSDNFYQWELEKSDTAIRNGIDNTIPEILVPKMALTCNKILEPVRAHYKKSISPTSGFRCFDLEKILCAKSIVKWLKKNPGKTIDDYLPLKSHPKAESVDFEISGVHNTDLYNWIKENLEFDQCILEFHDPKIPNSGWVHASYSEGNNRNQAFSIS